MSSYSLKFLSSRVIGIKVSSINLVKPVLNGLGLFFQVPQVNPARQLLSIASGSWRGRAMSSFYSSCCLSSAALSSKINKARTKWKRAGSMVDYSSSNYCATCLTKLPKEILRCPDCRQKVRTRPWHRPKLTGMKRV